VGLSAEQRHVALVASDRKWRSTVANKKDLILPLGKGLDMISTRAVLKGTFRLSIVAAFV
jgi:hypothetical protein